MRIISIYSKKTLSRLRGSEYDYVLVHTRESSRKQSCDVLEIERSGTPTGQHIIVSLITRDCLYRQEEFINC